MKLLSIFFAVILSWILTEEIWPCLLTMCLLPFTGLMNVNEMLAIGLGSDITFFLITLFIFIALLNESGTATMIAGKLLSQKFLQGHPWRLIFMIFLTTIIISSFCNAFTGILLSWGLIYKICEKLDYKPYDKFSVIMIFGVAVMGAIGLSTLPWSISVLTILNAYTSMTGNSINFISYLIYSVPLGVLSIFGYMILCKFCFKLDVNKLKNMPLNNLFSKEELLFTKERKIVLGALLLLISLILIQNIFPNSFLGIYLSKLGMSLKGTVILLLLSLVKINGNNLINFNSLAKKGVPWNVILMVLVINVFVNYFNQPSVGLVAFLSQTFIPLLNNTSILIFLILIALITILLTNLMNNIVIAIIMITATMPLISILNIEQIHILFLIISSAFIAFLLPPASAPSMCLFSNQE